MEGKYCSGCKEVQPLDAFSNNKTTKDGKSSWCKKCNASYNASYRVKHRLRCIWDGMRYRCTHVNIRGWWYHGKVKVCADWLEFANFEAWALGNGYAANLSIHRKDNNGDYEPGNCVWLTRSDHTKAHRGELFRRKAE